MGGQANPTQRSIKTTVEITVKRWRMHYAGDKKFFIEDLVIDGSKLDWWKARSGKGDWVLLSAHPMGQPWRSLL